jgi:uncharacterized protein DUF6526
MTPTQTYATHHHQPRMTYVGTVCLLVAVLGFVLRWFYIGGRYTMALGLAGLLAATFVLLLISRAYITALQDRIIKLEMRERARSVLTPALQETLFHLAKAQIIALRFASDAELPGLIERASRENLTPDAIKRAITNWVPDWDRT